MRLHHKMKWAHFVSAETVPKVRKNDQIFSAKPSGRSWFQSIFEIHPNEKRWINHHFIVLFENLLTGIYRRIRIVARARRIDMKGIYAVFILLQLLAAFLQRDKNRIAYLRYLWSSHFEHGATAGGGVFRAGSITIAQETKPDDANHEYPLLLER